MTDNTDVQQVSELDTFTVREMDMDKYGFRIKECDPICVNQLIHIFTCFVFVRVSKCMCVCNDS